MLRIDGDQAEAHHSGPVAVLDRTQVVPAGREPGPGGRDGDRLTDRYRLGGRRGGQVARRGRWHDEGVQVDVLLGTSAGEGELHHVHVVRARVRESDLLVGGAAGAQVPQFPVPV